MGTAVGKRSVHIPMFKCWAKLRPWGREKPVLERKKVFYPLKFCT